MSCINKIRNEIDKNYDGEAFSACDFISFGAYDAVRQALTRLNKEGYIRRVVRGVYDKPMYSNILNQFSCPSPYSVARALARKYNWTISVSGVTALNMLGLSTQVPAKFEYISSGPNKKYKFGNRTIVFHHRSDKLMQLKSPMTLLVVSALKILRKDSINDKLVSELSNNLSIEDKQNLLNESKASPLWMHKIINKICEDIV